MSRARFKIGDDVRIVRPRFVERVGYPLIWTDLVREFQEHPKLWDAMRLLGIVESDEVGVNPESRLAKEFASGCAKAAVRMRRFGGRERSIHYKQEMPPLVFLSSGASAGTHEALAGQRAHIYGKRVVMTGKYYAPSGGYDYWGEYDYEPGGLEDRQAHVLLMTEWGEIEQCDVEPWTEAPVEAEAPAR